MDIFKVSFYIVLSINAFNAQSVNLAAVKSFDELYADGLEAYWNENWEDCIYYLEESFVSYRIMRDFFKNCSSECHNTGQYPYQLQSNLFSFFIDKASCLEACEKEKLGRSGVFSRISTESLNNFKNKKAYVYLQFAYFQAGEFRKSVEAAYTYSQYDPNDVMMQENMKFFYDHQNATSEMFINRELSSFVIDYNSGIKSFADKDYQAATYHFEKSLMEFYKAEEECRAMCEGEYDGGEEYLDEVTSFHYQTVDHYRHVLECYLTCPNETARTSRHQHIENFVPNLYSYLYHSYLHNNDKMNALRCLKSLLLFFPNDPVYISRLSLFKEMESSTREEADKFDRMLRLYAALLRFIYQNFGFRGKDVSNVFDKDAAGIYFENEMDAQTGFQRDAASLHSASNHRDGVDERDDVDISHLHETPIGYSMMDSKYLIDITDSSSVENPPTPEGPILFESSKLLANSSQMAGPLRFALDNFSSSEDCQTLIDLELTGGLPGDGYKGKPSPHTEHELFNGISVLRAAQLAERKALTLEAAQLYYDLSERVRQQVAAYFKLDHLYFDYTHLVCRTALKGGQEKRGDISHPIHADNCILHNDSRCVKEPPAYTWRDYSAIMYLNSDFEGGQFVMTDQTARRVMVQVRPECGRLVSFSAGKECLHGVKPVTRGRRCAMALWFTLDPAYDESSRKEAKVILNRLLRNEL